MAYLVGEARGMLLTLLCELGQKETTSWKKESEKEVIGNKVLMLFQ